MSPFAAEAAQEIAALRVDEICNLLFSLRYVHSESSEKEIFQILDSLEGEFLVLELDFNEFRAGARWAVARLRTSRPDGQPRRKGGGRKKGGGR